jgi:thymidine kinase
VNLYLNSNIGILEVVTGSMFSGKSEELIRRLRRSQYAKQKVIVFKHSIDTRYGEASVISHSKDKIDAFPAGTVEEMDKFLKNHPDVEVIGIDEVQFFGSEVVEFCEKYVNLGKRVIIAGLDMDFRGEPFDPMPKLMSIADYVDKFHAICTVCGNPAYVSQRIINGEPAYYDDPVVLVGADESYEARCRGHHIVKKRDKKESKLYFIVGTDMGVGKEEVENIYLNELENGCKYETIKIKEDIGSESKIDDIREEIVDKMNANDVVFVRIIGGILLPLNGKYNILDLIREFRKDSEIILVANNKKGILNHILLTNEILSNSNVNVKEIVYTKNSDIEVESEEMFDQIQKITKINYRQI